MNIGCRSNSDLKETMKTQAADTNISPEESIWGGLHTLTDHCFLETYSNRCQKKKILEKRK